MLLNTDHHFLMGYSHHICEDYALSEVFEANQKQYAIAIVSDGCSSSENTDFGARILAREFLSSIKSMISVIDSSENSYHLLRMTTISSAQKIAGVLSLPYTALDATIIAALTDGEKVWLFFYGDGTARINYVDGSYLQYNIDFGNAPYYMSYLLDKSRQDKYFETFGSILSINTIALDTNNEIPVIRNNTQNYSIRDFSERYVITPHQQIQSISVSSDGIDSFVKDFSLSVIMDNEFNGFKNFKGDFVKRRLNAIKRKCQKENIVHHDDISLAAIHIERE